MSVNLKIKQQKFADEYIICGNATQAAIAAGYSKRSAKQTGSRLLEHPNVKAYIEERLKALESEKIAEQDEVLQFLTSVMRGEVTEEVPIMVGDGVQEVREINASIKDRSRAAELLGKRWGSWTDKVDLASDLTLVFEDDYGDEEG